MKKWLFLIILFLLIGIFLWQGIYVPRAPTSEKEIIFQIAKGQGSREIAFNLEKEDIIKWGPIFRIYVFFAGQSKKLQAGTYKLSPSMNIPEIARKIISGEIVKIAVTIPEGFTVKQIEERIGLKLPGENLEGFLFPDTYQFSYGVLPEEIMRKMLDNFDKKLNADLKEEIKRQGKTIFEVVTMASLIEKEVKTLEDKKLVSGILWKRLKNNIPLQVDATITYLTGKKTTKVSVEETKIDSPYNTYKYKGLPLGPICNPGLESISAAIYPKSSEYWYYLSTPEGKTIFSRTLNEHNINKAKYLK